MLKLCGIRAGFPLFARIFADSEKSACQMRETVLYWISCSMDSVWRRIEAVITGLTRNFGRSWEFRPPDSPWYSSTQKISKSNIFCRLSCFLSNEFLSKFLERKPDENRHGELSEWSKVQHSKSWIHAGRLPMAIPWFSRLAGLLGLELKMCIRDRCGGASM